jgi:valyl-tRNA synthetase
MTGADGPEKTETQAMVGWVLDEATKLLHPFMPFITEELWATTIEGQGTRPNLLCLTAWPVHSGLEDAAAEAEIGWVVDLVTAIRSVRAEMNVPAGAQVPLVLAGVSSGTRERAGRWTETLKRLARLSEIAFADEAPRGAVQAVVRGEVAALPLGDVIDLKAERERLTKEIGKVDQEIGKIDAKLNNPDFVKRAPEEVIDEQRERRDEASERREKMAAALARLAQAG